VLLSSLWLNGSTRTGKTTRLVEEFRDWVEGKLRQSVERKVFLVSRARPSALLVFAANDDNRQSLADKLSISVQGTYPVICKTPLGFFSDEVMLFFPLLFEMLNLKAQFPLRLRPETEQELATRVWKPYLTSADFPQTDTSEYRFVRETLDLLQLAGASGIPVEDIPTILESGLPETTSNPSIPPQKIGELLLEWRQWCLDRGLLTYGIIYELYGRYLLPDSKYQHYLTSRYEAIFADDLDDYPAIARDLFTLLLERGISGVFTYNPNGQVRLGLNADPNYLAGLASRCEVEELSLEGGLAAELGDTVVELVTDPFFITSLPEGVQSLQTTSRAELLRRTGNFIIEAVQQGEVRPEDIAIIAPGLDEIARYTLIEILSTQGIPIEPLNEQRSLISSPLIRSLLTLLGLVYPGLGRLVRRDEVAEMLVILTRKPRETESDREGKLIPEIDPVRAGLIADYCYHIDLENPRLLAVESFPRWDRLGHRATAAYRGIIEWVEEAKSLLQQQRFASPIVFLDKAIKSFVGNGSHLPYDQLAALRELMETAQHYWEVDRRLRQNEPIAQSQTTTVAQFIQLLRRGTITANPRPVRIFGAKPGAIALATIFQYRALRSFHRWQFWLDAGSSLWDKGGAAILYAAPLFQREWSGRTLMPEDEYEADQARLKRILRDLLGRVGERVYLCHSELGVKGTEQVGPLFTLVNASKEIS
jgi:hypothetical protein